MVARMKDMATEQEIREARGILASMRTAPLIVKAAHAEKLLIIMLGLIEKLSEEVENGKR